MCFVLPPIDTWRTVERFNYSVHCAEIMCAECSSVREFVCCLLVFFPNQFRSIYIYFFSSFWTYLCICCCKIENTQTSWHLLIVTHSLQLEAIWSAPPPSSNKHSKFMCVFHSSQRKSKKMNWNVVFLLWFSKIFISIFIPYL